MDELCSAFGDIVGDAGGLYVVLGVGKTATSGEIKKAYYKLALRCHPDKCPVTATEEERALATARFQALSVIHKTLSDGERRALYDDTNDVWGGDDDDGDGGGDGGWKAYWRAMFPSVDEANIGRMEREYKGSREERGDLLAAYEEHKGDFEAVMACVMFAETDEDEERLRGVVTEAVQGGEVQAYPKFTSTNDKKNKKRRGKKRKDESKEFEELAAKIRNRGREGSGQQLVSTGILAGLEARYGGGGGGKKKQNQKRRKRREDEEPSEEEFAAAQARLAARR